MRQHIIKSKIRNKSRTIFTVCMIHHRLLNYVKKFIGRKHSWPPESVGDWFQDTHLEYQNLWLVKPFMIPKGYHLHYILFEVLRYNSHIL